MTNHIISDELFAGEFATIRDAYRVGEGNSTIRAMCEDQVHGPGCVCCRAFYSGRCADPCRLPSDRGKPHDGPWTRGITQCFTHTVFGSDS